jgi:hypothetical protein
MPPRQRPSFRNFEPRGTDQRGDSGQTNPMRRDNRPLRTDQISHQPQESGTDYVGRRQREIRMTDGVSEQQALVNAIQELQQSDPLRFLQYMQDRARNLRDIPGLPSAILHEPGRVSSNTPTRDTFTRPQYQPPRNVGELIDNPPPGSMHQRVRDTAIGYRFSANPQAGVPAYDEATHDEAYDGLTEQERLIYREERQHWERIWGQADTQHAGPSSSTGGTLVEATQRLRMAERLTVDQDDDDITPRPSPRSRTY